MAAEPYRRASWYGSAVMYAATVRGRPRARVLLGGRLATYRAKSRPGPPARARITGRPGARAPYTVNPDFEFTTNSFRLRLPYVTPATIDAFSAGISSSLSPGAALSDASLKASYSGLMIDST